MSVSPFEFHVEEPSMEMFLKAWLPRYLPNGVTFDIHTYRGKPALLRKIGDRLRGYAAWIPVDLRIVVVVNRDRDDCEKLKQKLENLCKNAGLRSRRASGRP